jgi:hypothetical protein
MIFWMKTVTHATINNIRCPTDIGSHNGFCIATSSIQETGKASAKEGKTQTVA